MIQPLRRSALFRAVPHADHFIATMQQSYASMLDPGDPQDRAEHKRLYDHLQPFRSDASPFNAYGVIAYPADTCAAYEAGFPAALGQLLADLRIERVAVLDFIDRDLDAFPFGSFRQRNRLRALAGRTRDIGGLLIDREEVPRVLPLFFDARRWDIPVIFFISAAECPVSLRLCDDGNLHYDCAEGVHATFIGDAEERGFVCGDTALCSEHSVAYFRNGRPA